MVIGLSSSSSNSNWSIIKSWCSKEVHEQGRLSHNGGRSAWASFSELHKVLFPQTLRYREAYAELLVTKCMVAPEEEGAADRLTPAKEDHTYAYTSPKSVDNFYLGLND
ncbi:hypothetical protein D1007_14412 [Hordeum vulgare]|nr:hypothetical protein D1007_14412 [Hordeum vulgare]